MIRINLELPSVEVCVKEFHAKHYGCSFLSSCECLFYAGDRVQEAYEIGRSVPPSMTCEITQPISYGDASKARVTSLSRL